MGSIAKAVKEITEICNNNKHGYSMTNRNGSPDYDCSSLVIHCLEYAGFPMKKYGATYTGNMIYALHKCGFKNIIKQIDLKTGKGLAKGDILLNENYHTAMMVSATKMAAAHWNYDGKKGDSSGKEISITKYSNYSKGWTSIWRYFIQPERDAMNNYSIAFDCILGKYGNGNDRKANIEQIGYNYEEIQSCVNNILKYRNIVKKVMKGDYGNGKDRIKLLTIAGYDYNVIQDIINTIMTGGMDKYEYYFRDH